MLSSNATIEAATLRGSILDTSFSENICWYQCSAWWRVGKSWEFCWPNAASVIARCKHSNDERHQPDTQYIQNNRDREAISVSLAYFMMPNVNRNLPEQQATPNASSTLDRPRGYHKLAALVGSYSEMVIFPQFGALNMLNLLSMQAELVDLELRFQNISRQNENFDGAAPRDYSIEFRSLRSSQDTVDDLQWQTLLKIQEKLERYSRLLLPKLMCFCGCWVPFTRHCASASSWTLGAKKSTWGGVSSSARLVKWKKDGWLFPARPWAIYLERGEYSGSGHYL